MIKIFTDRGIKNINDINNMDFVYEYDQKRKILVRDLISMDNEELYLIEFSDGRKGKYFGNEIFIGWNCQNRKYESVKVNQLYDRFVTSKTNNEEYKIELRTNSCIEFGLDVLDEIIPYHNIPYYTIGYMICDYDNESSLFNISNVDVESIEYISHYHNIVPYNGIDTKHITFKTNYQKDVHVDDIIPTEYMSYDNKTIDMKLLLHTILYSSEFDRMEFIRGMMDNCGDIINSNISPLYFMNSNPDLIDVFVNIVRSLGFIVSIKEHDNSYIAYIICNDKRIYDFFYNMKIKNKIDLEMLKILNNHPHVFHNNILSINKLGIHHRYQLLLEHDRMLYIDSNFLPRLSK